MWSVYGVFVTGARRGERARERVRETDVCELQAMYLSFEGAIEVR